MFSPYVFAGRGKRRRTRPCCKGRTIIFHILSNKYVILSPGEKCNRAGVVPVDEKLCDTVVRVARTVAVREVYKRTT